MDKYSNNLYSKTELVNYTDRNRVGQFVIIYILMGFLGVHNFIIGQWKIGVTKVVVNTLYLVYMVTLFSTKDISTYSPLEILLYLGIIFLYVALVVGFYIIEGILIVVFILGNLKQSQIEGVEKEKENQALSEPQEESAKSPTKQ